MAVYTLSAIVKDVRIALDQNASSDALSIIGDVDTLSLEDIIKSKILEAVDRVHSDAPAYLLDGGNNFGDAIYWMSNESGWALLPEDFMRLIVFEMDDWERPIFTALNVDDPEYKKQSSRFKGVRGTAQKPLCVISIRPEGRVLEFFSCNSQEAMVSRAVYIPYTAIDEYNAVNICQRCYRSVIYTIVVLVLITLGDIERSSIFSELAKSSLI